MTSLSSELLEELVNSEPVTTAHPMTTFQWKCKTVLQEAQVLCPPRGRALCITHFRKDLSTLSAAASSPQRRQQQAAVTHLQTAVPHCPWEGEQVTVSLGFFFPLSPLLHSHQHPHHWINCCPGETVKATNGPEVATFFVVRMGDEVRMAPQRKATFFLKGDTIHTQQQA